MPLVARSSVEQDREDEVLTGVGRKAVGPAGMFFAHANALNDWGRREASVQDGYVLPEFVTGTFVSVNIEERSDFTLSD